MTGVDVKRTVRGRLTRSVAKHPWASLWLACMTILEIIEQIVRAVGS